MPSRVPDNCISRALLLRISVLIRRFLHRIHMKISFRSHLFIAACLVAAAPYAFGQNVFPANAVEANQIGTRADLTQEIIVLRQQQVGLKAESDRYGQDTLRLKRDLDMAETTRKDSAASIAALNLSISTLSAQEKALTTRISLASEREGQLTVLTRTLNQELENLKTLIKQEKETAETMSSANGREISRRAELTKAQQDVQARQAIENKTVDDATLAKKVELASLDSKAAQDRDEKNKQADIGISARKQLAEQTWEAKVKASDEEISKRRAAVTKELDALDAEAKLAKDTAGLELVAMRKKMLLDATAEVNKKKEQDVSQGSAKLAAANKQLLEVETKVREAEAKARAADTRGQKTDAKAAQLVRDQQALETRQAQLQAQTQALRNTPVVGTASPIALAQKELLEQEIVQMRRQLDGLKSDELANQIRKNMTPDKN